MNGQEYRYVQLINSLPRHGPLFQATLTPLSRIKLRQRLALLEADDARRLARVAELLDWGRHNIERSDAQIVARARRLIPKLDNDFLRELVDWRMQLRTLVAALRRRRRGENAPDPGLPWGYGRWLTLIRTHWHEPHFGLERVFPWLPQAREHLDNGNANALEKVLLSAVWQHLDRVSEGHEFDFEAVLIYVMRWDLVARWVGYQADGATQRFEEMVEDTLSTFDFEALAA